MNALAESPMTRRHGAAWDITDDRGIGSLEVALLAALLLSLCAFVAFASRLTQANGLIADAAAEGARAASIAAPFSAHDEAVRSVGRVLNRADQLCPSPEVAVSQAERVGTHDAVRVTVTCDIPLSNLAMAGLPGERTITATRVSVIDEFRND